MLSERSTFGSSDPLLDETRLKDRLPETWSRLLPGLDGQQAGLPFDRLNHLAAQALRAPLSLTSVVDRSREMVLGAFGLSEDAREFPVSVTFCGLVLASGAPIVIRDARAVPELADIAAWRDGWVACLCVPVVNASGEVTASLCVLDREPRQWRASDLSLLQSIASLVGQELAEGTAQQMLRDSERRLSQILDASGAGTWAWDALASSEVWDATFRRQFGFTEDEPATFDGWIGRVHPEDRPGLQARLNEILATPGDDRWDMEFRVLLPTGEVRWMRGFGQAARSAEGHVTGISGVNFDVTATHQARIRLHEGEQRFRLAAEVAELGLIEVDYGAGTATPDTRAADLFGLAPGMAVPRDDVHDRFHPEDRDRILRLIEASLDPEGSGTFAAEHRVVRPDGTVLWLQVKKQVRFKGSRGERRPASSLLVAFDITDRKLAEERSQLLSRELAHRSKNLLTLVQAIARQTASTAEAFLPRFEERLAALAASQDLLVSEAGEGVDLDALVRRQLAHFQDLLDSRIRLRGPPVRLNAPSAQALGMAFHELSTNAGKYGALSDPHGRIEVAWAAGDGRLTLSWTERDGPRVEAPSRTGFGGVVIDRMVRGALEGEIQLDYAPQGFSWHLSCPMRTITEPV